MKTTKSKLRRGKSIPVNHKIIYLVGTYYPGSPACCSNLCRFVRGFYYLCYYIIVYFYYYALWILTRGSVQHKFVATVDYLKIENISIHINCLVCVWYDNEMCACVKRLWFQKGFVHLRPRRECMFVIPCNDYILNNIKPVVYYTHCCFFPLQTFAPTRFNRTISQKTKYFMRPRMVFQK